MNPIRTIPAALVAAVIALLAASAMTRTTPTAGAVIICPLDVPGCCPPPISGARAAVLPCCPVPTAGTIPCCTAAPCPAGLSLAATPDPATASHNVTLSGTLSSGPAAAQTVDLWERPAGQTAFTDVANTQTSASGSFQFVRAVKTNAEWYAKVGSLQSPIVAELVRAAVVLRASTVRPAAGALLALSGTIAPSHAGARVALQLLKGGLWVTIARPVVNSRSRFVVAQTVHAQAGSSARFRVMLAADARNAQSISRVVKITVR